MAPAFEATPPASGPLITGFSRGRFRIGDTVFPGALLMTPRDARPWEAPALDRVSAGDLDSILAIAPQPEFLLLGTGAALVRPPRGLAAALDGQGIGVEAMDSRAAARAWSVLRAEGRWIVAALYALGWTG